MTIYYSRNQLIFASLFLLVNLSVIVIMEISRKEKPQSDEPPKKVKKASQKSNDLNWDFPKTIDEYGYEFNSDGELVHKKTGGSYEFAVSDNDLYNQKRYEALGELITEHVYSLLETEVKLKRTHIPVDAADDEPQSFIFLSEDALTNTNKLLVLIHGSGVVRAGQWARRLIINDCLDNGTQLPFIKRGVSEGYGIIVLNTNLNSIDGKRIRGSANSNEHTDYVWKHFIEPSKAKNIAIVAHSFGGVNAISLVEKYHEIMQKRVFALAMTDSVHNLEKQGIPHLPQMKWLREIARNWVSSSKELDEPVASYGRIDIYKVSAGTKKHEETSCNSFNSIFKFLNERYQSLTTDNHPTHEL